MMFINNCNGHFALVKEKIMRKIGFTLAEVLITLMIIGIVAALTIPSVISNYQQQEFKTGLKKAVSVLNEAIQTNIAMDGETPYENENLLGYLQRHMSIIKTVQGSMYIDSYRDSNDVYHGSASNNAFYTADGIRFEYGQMTQLKLHESDESAINYKQTIPYPGATFYAIQDKNGNCGSYGLTSNANNTIYPPCVLTVDVNGDKKPTVYGSNISISEDKTSHIQNYKYPSPSDKKITDIFNILITEDRAIPFGVVAQRAMYSK